VVVAPQVVEAGDEPESQPAEAGDDPHPQLQPAEPPTICAAEPNNDYYTVESGQTLTVLWSAGLLQNDVLCGGYYTTEIVSGPSSGWLTDEQAIQGSFQYTPEAGFGKFFEEYDCFTYALLQDDVEYGQAEACIRVDTCTIVAAADAYLIPHETALTVPAPGCSPTTRTTLLPPRTRRASTCSRCTLRRHMER
jgi:hypothetical protein